MGRKAGVAAEDTRSRLLESAARVFARRGYSGASIAEITSEAGLTSGAVYAHYASKAELFVETLRAHGDREVDRLLGAAEPSGLLEAVASIGATFDRRERSDGSLLVAAVIAARDDPEVAAMVVEGIVQREGEFAALLRAGQEAGSLDRNVSADALARFCLMVSFGSLLAGALDLEPPEHDEWTRLMVRLVGSFR